MKIATILFTYDRSKHTRKVIEALAVNTKKPEKLFVFQDAAEAGDDLAEWEKVKEIITDITWCDTEVHIADKKKGCSRSIIDGIDYVLQEYEAVIVLEDDCVPHPQFLSYMDQALRKYKNFPKVYSVGGYAWDVDLPLSQMDAYFNGRTSSWGWGTWRDRWAQFQEDYRIVRKIKKTEEGKERLSLWGADLENMVIGNVTGACDAWDVFWSLTVIKNDGVCLSPYDSLILNIGMDGSGTHCGVRKDEGKNFKKKYQTSFALPEEIKISRECKQEFYNLFLRTHGVEKLQSYQNVLLKWLGIKQMGGKVKEEKVRNPAAIWGKGAICDLLLQELQGIADIKCILETYPSVDGYKGIQVCGIAELPVEVKTIFVIPFFDIEQISYKAKKWRTDVEFIGIDRFVETFME